MTLLSRIGRGLIRLLIGELADEVELPRPGRVPSFPEEEPMPLTQKSVRHQRDQIAQATSPRAIVPRPAPPPRKR